MILGINLPREFGNLELLRHLLLPYLQISRLPAWDLEKISIPEGCKAEPFLRALTAQYGIPLEIGLTHGEAEVLSSGEGNEHVTFILVP